MLVAVARDPTHLQMDDPEWATSWVNLVAWSLLPILYFTVLEGRYGCALGKWLLHLRVCRSEGRESPGLLRGLWRTTLFFAVVNGPSLAAPFLLNPEEMDPETFSLLAGGLGLLGMIVLLLLPMRAHGYRGFHERLSGTRRDPAPLAGEAETLSENHRAGSAAAGPDARTARPVPGAGRAALDRPKHPAASSSRGAEAEKVLVGEDRALARKVWLWVRHDHPLPGRAPRAARRHKAALVDGRSRRRRGVGCFSVRRGCLLRDAVAGAGKLTWTETRPLLEDLTEELLLARAEGTLPERLSLDHVWVQPQGRAQLLDFPPGDPPAPEGEPACPPLPPGERGRG